MKINTADVQLAKKDNFKKLFKLKDNSTSKLEFKFNGIAYEIKYDDEILGWYNTESQDGMILDFLEVLATYNNGDSQTVKTKLDHLIEDKSMFVNQQYQTTYKNNVLKYLLGLEENTIKSACIEENLTYQQLADAIGVSESSLRSSVSTNKVSKQVEKSIEMYLKIVYLEKELEKSNTIKTILKSWLK